MEKIDYKFGQLKSAALRLQEALALDFPTAETKSDAVIQRFEFTTELFWKFLKVLLEDKGVVVNAAPIDVIRAAKTASVLAADEQWIALVRDRNISSHTYDEAQAKVIYERVRDTYAEMFQQFIDGYENSDSK